MRRRGRARRHAVRRGEGPCTALEKSSDDCSFDSTIDHVKCLGAMKSYRDETLTDAKKCADKACNAIWDCVDATL